MFQSQSWIYRHICVLLIGMGEKEREEHCLIVLRVRPRSCIHYFCSHLIDKNLIIQPYIYAKYSWKMYFQTGWHLLAKSQGFQD